MTLNEAERSDLLGKLDDFKKKLVDYGNLAYTLLEKATMGHQWRNFQILRDDLQRIYGGLKAVIEEYGGTPFVTVADRQSDVFDLALGSAKPTKLVFSALDHAIMVVNKAIGKLQLPPSSRAEAQDIGVTQLPKVFIGHGGQSARLRRLCDFLQALGVEPVVVEWSASEGRWTEEHVDKQLEDSDCYIILAEYGGIVDVKTGAKHPRLNVIDELARSRQRRSSRTILLLERGIDLPSNVSGIVYERFTKRNMEKALTKVARELRAFGLIRAMKG